MKKLSKVLKIIVVLVLLLVLIVNIYIIFQTKSKPNAVPSVFGYKPFIVLSGSMEPEFGVGDLIIIKTENVDNLQTGDIIAFRDSENLVTTHRIIDKVNLETKECFKTKGDNNNTEDQMLVCKNQIEGKYHSKIAKAGNVLLFIQKPTGFVIMLLSVFIIGLMVWLSENKKVSKEFEIKDEEELKEFEEFKKAKKQNKE